MSTMSTMSTMSAVRAVGCHFAIAARPGRLWMEDISDFAGCRVQFNASSAGPCERSRSRDWWREVGENCWTTGLKREDMWCPWCKFV